MKSKALQILKERAREFKRAQYAGVPFNFIPDSQYSDSTANRLTKCVIDWLTFNGHQAERINNTGKVVDSRKEVQDVLGRTRIIGSVSWVKGTGCNGTADISATINGRSVKIEVKVKKDFQSADQIWYQASIEAAGGVYVIATDFESFYSWYISYASADVIKEKGGPV